uniref:Uncharacterized protein n=1 Tax=Physcomitrium patens TaxID=3218 RepID=A0A2K1IM97_PHYPA|nr:hypothetical protein PHYPA_026714 [Physcomitrium patens]
MHRGERSDKHVWTSSFQLAVSFYRPISSFIFGILMPFTTVDKDIASNLISIICGARFCFQTSCLASVALVVMEQGTAPISSRRRNQTSCT